MDALTSHEPGGNAGIELRKKQRVRRRLGWRSAHWRGPCQIVIVSGNGNVVNVAGQDLYKPLIARRRIPPKVPPQRSPVGPFTQTFGAYAAGLMSLVALLLLSSSAPPSPVAVRPSAWPAGKTALCHDGSYSASRHRGGTCSWHGGVARWREPAPLAAR